LEFLLRNLIIDDKGRFVKPYFEAELPHKKCYPKHD
jgi:hypothetical protein